MSGGKIRDVPWHSERWLSGTRNLTNEERGVYITAISLIYDAGGPIARHEIVSWCTHKSNRRAVAKIIDHLIFRRKLLLIDGDMIDQPVCEEELAKLRHRETAAELPRNRSETAAELPRNISAENNDLTSQTRAPTRVEDNITTTTFAEPFEGSVDPDGSTGADAPNKARDPVKELFDLGIGVLGNSARSLIGKARKQYGDLVTGEALLACRAAAPSHPVEFFIGCLRQRGTVNDHRRRKSPAEKLFAGFAAAAGFDFSADRPPDVPLLDGRRSGTD